MLARLLTGWLLAFPICDDDGDPAVKFNWNRRSEAKIREVAMELLQRRMAGALGPFWLGIAAHLLSLLCRFISSNCHVHTFGLSMANRYCFATIVANFSVCPSFTIISRWIL